MHWTGSSDDAAVAEVLIDAGANIDMPDGSIGTPIANAVGYGCWNVAHLLAARGASVDSLWVAAALGLLDRLDELLADQSVATTENISQGFWHAVLAVNAALPSDCLARALTSAGCPTTRKGTALDAARGHGTQRANVIEWLEQQGVRSTESADGGNGE